METPNRILWQHQKDLQAAFHYVCQPTKTEHVITTPCILQEKKATRKTLLLHHRAHPSLSLSLSNTPICVKKYAEPV